MTTDYEKVLDILSKAMRFLPPSGRWTARERARWLAFITAIVDYAVEIVPDEQPAPPPPAGEA